MHCRPCVCRRYLGSCRVSTNRLNYELGKMTIVIRRLTDSII